MKILIFTHFLPTVGFLLALVLLLHLFKQQRSPSNTIAWVLAIILMPYVGVPLYIMLGGRKMKKMTGRKEIAPFRTIDDVSVDCNGIIHTGQTSADTLFPCRKGNTVRLLLSGEEAFRCLRELIEHARESICITTYILGNDSTGQELLAALAAKAREGVDVCLLMDALGSNSIKDSFLSEYKTSGGRYAFFMPMLHIPFRGRANLRNHRKMVVVDGRTAVIGGMNLACEYMGEAPSETRWHDLSLSVEGPVVADILTVFQSDWNFASGEVLPAKSVHEGITDHCESTLLQLVPSGPDVVGDPLFDTVISALFSARERIWIVTPYFIPDEMMVKALCMASKRGVDVRIIVPEVSNHRLADIVRRNYLRQIEEAGAVVYRFKHGMLHGKLIVIDDSLGIVGSMNMDMRSFFLNYEAALLIYSKSIVASLKVWFNSLEEKSATGVTKESVFVDYLEGLARTLAPLL